VLLEIQAAGQHEQVVAVGGDRGQLCPQNYLEPLHSTAALPPNGSSAFWSNPQFDDLVAQGNKAASNEDAIALYQQADDVLLEERPIAAMFFGVEQSVHAERVADVLIDVFGLVDVASVGVVG
jgi:oligopeptide transport system substrate-binding protein